MRTSLTEAVKLAATSDASLTDAVKSAAREAADHRVIGFPREAADHRVISFPREALDGHHDGSQGGRHPWGPVPAADRRAMRAPRVEPEPAMLRSKAGLFRRAGTQWKAVRFDAVAFKRALLNPAFRMLAIGVKLAGVAVLSFLSLAATPTIVGPADRAAPASAQKRVALVIGNSAYRYARKLHNPKNDATDIGAALKTLGFQVIEGFDLDRAALDAKIREFTAFLRGADVGVFFYAGHGLQVSGHNYLVPIDAQLTAVSALDRELVGLDLIHQTMEREAETNLLFFDACRDNPLFDNLARAIGTRSAEIGRGLAVVESGAGTLISFSTQPGTLALDGKGRNSPYSAALLKQLTTSNDDLAAMLIAVRNEVMQQTDRKQVPWEHSALTERFYFNPAAERRAGPPAARPRSREAFEAWSAAKDTTRVGVLEAFIARYADTFYAELARARIEELKEKLRAPLSAEKLSKLSTPLPAMAGAPSSFR